MKELYMVALGGKTRQSTIEVHDLQFVVGENIEETFEILVNQWYGIKKKLHMDSYKHIQGADGYSVEITSELPNTSENSMKLYLVNIGGYVESSMLEIHRIGLFVAKSEGEARTKGKKALFKGDLQEHIDNVVEVNSCLANGEQFFLKLTEDHKIYTNKPDWFGYKRLDII